MATKSTGVVDELNSVYPCVLTAFEQFHRQEHRFEVRYRYKVLVKRYDKLVHAARCWRRALLNRIEALGGEAESKIEKVVVEDDVKKAYEATHDLLEKIATALDDAIEKARDEAVRDYTSHKILLELRKEVEHKCVKVRAWLNQVDDMKQNYLVTVVN
jgi:bacterioferritin (cytochrome b1)